MSDSDSEDFQSADEFISDEENDNCKNRSNDDFTNPLSEDTLEDLVATAHKEATESAIKSMNSLSCELNGNSEELQDNSQPYRKRPELRSRSVDKDTSDLKQIIDVVKVARPDNLIKGITSQITTNITKGLNNPLASNIGKGLRDHLTSNITKGLSAFQENSTLVKELVLGTGDSLRGDLKFSYNDDRLIDDNNADSNAELDVAENVIHDAIILNHPALNDAVAISDNDKLEAKEVAAATPESLLNKEILKLSQAFARLNEKQNNTNETPDNLRSLFSNDEFVEKVVDETISNAILHVERISGDKLTNESVNASSQTKMIETIEASSGQTNKFSEPDNITNNNRIVKDMQSSEVGNKEISQKEAAPLIGEEECTAILKEKDPQYFRETTEEITSGVSGEQGEPDEGWGDWGDDEEVIEGEPDDGLNSGQVEGEIQLVNTNTSFIELKQQENENLEKDLDGWGDWGDNTTDGNEDGAKIKNDWGDFEDDIPSQKNTEVEKTVTDVWGDWGDTEDDDVDTVEKNKESTKLATNLVESKISIGASEQEWKGWEKFGEKKESEWGGWGFSSLLNTASAVTSNLSAVTHGISSVIESGLGVPDPETMARIQKSEEEKVNRESSGVVSRNEREGSFPFRNIVAGVGKIVDATKVQEIGSRVLSGGLDTLETIGKKTMEVLQEGDPGLKKKKALLVGHGQALSTVLREAKERAAAAEQRSDQAAANRRCHLETLFDDFQGLVHLEALEMLSKQCELRLDQIMSSLPPTKVNDMKDTLEEVRQLCEMDEDFTSDGCGDNFKDLLTETVHPLRNELNVDKILEVHGRLTIWLQDEGNNSSTARLIYERALSIIAELAAAATQQFHKAGELLILKERRKTVEEADCLLQLCNQLCFEFTSISENVNLLLLRTSNSETEMLRTNLAVEADNASAYIKQAFQLLVPVLQLGAA